MLPFPYATLREKYPSLALKTSWIPLNQSTIPVDTSRKNIPKIIPINL